MLACVPGLALDRYEQWIKRGVVVLPARVGKGTGKPRVYLAEDVAQVATIHELARHGFAPRDARLIWLGVVAPRLRALSTEQPGDPTIMAALIVRDPVTDDLVCQPVREGTDEGDEALNHPQAPDTVTLFRTDRFLARVALRLDAAKAGAAPPDEPSPLRGADPHPTQSFVMDADGRKTLIGLTAAESLELFRLSEPGGLGQTDVELDAEEARREELQNRHEQARFRRLHAEAAKRGDNHEG
jgi:hypothetical protein